MSKNKVLSDSTSGFITIDDSPSLDEPTGEAYFQNTGRLKSLRGHASRNSSISPDVVEPFRVGRFRGAVQVGVNRVNRTNTGSTVRIGKASVHRSIRGRSPIFDNSGLLQIEENENGRNRRGGFKGSANTRIGKSGKALRSTADVRVGRDSSYQLRKKLAKKLGAKIRSMVITHSKQNQS